MPLPPYLVLLHAGFCLPPALPSARCALTAPFHPYPAFALSGFGEAVCFLCHFPSGFPARALPGALPCGVRTFLPPPSFGLRRGKPGDLRWETLSPRAEGTADLSRRSAKGAKADGRLADCDSISIAYRSRCGFLV